MARSFLHIVILVSLASLSAMAQVGMGALAIGAEGFYTLPIGGLDARFTQGMGGALLLRDAAGSGQKWGFRLEYLAFRESDQKSLSIERKRDIGAGSQDFSVPLSGVTMSLSSIGFLVTSTHPVLQEGSFGMDLGYGFGFYRWRYDRSALSDTVMVDSAGTSVAIDILDVPSLSQQDWSGGFEAGFDIRLDATESVWISLSGRYRLIIGELWPTLDLDLENVSGMQMVDIRLGLHARL